MSYECAILQDSVSEAGDRLTTFQVTFPRFILAEVNTHRMLCLAGDAQLEFDHPGGQRRGRRVYKMSIADFVDRWHHGAAPRLNKGGVGHNRQPMRGRLSTMRIRQLNEDTGIIQTSTVVDCAISGRKPVYELRAGNFAVAASADHLFFTPLGYKRLGALRVGDEVVIRRLGKRAEDLLDPIQRRRIGGEWRSVWQRRLREKWTDRPCDLCGGHDGLQIHHVIPVYEDPNRAFDETNVSLLCTQCHADQHRTQGWQGGTYLYGEPIAIDQITQRGHEDTYDLEIAGPFPNFLANGIVVHNSRNSASSRAIPIDKANEAILRDMFVPKAFGVHQKGMQAESTLEGMAAEYAEMVWRGAGRSAVSDSYMLADSGVHKAWANRLPEPFKWHTAIITATEWGNFFALRDHPDAQPEFQEIAAMMREAYEANVPIVTYEGSWHTPLVSWAERRDTDKSDGPAYWDRLKRVSVGRCARVSVEQHDGVRDQEADISLHDRLEEKRHLSPFEHVARPFDDAERYLVHMLQAILLPFKSPHASYLRRQIEFQGNLRGWHSARMDVVNEHDFSEVLALRL